MKTMRRSLLAALGILVSACAGSDDTPPATTPEGGMDASFASADAALDAAPVYVLPPPDPGNASATGRCVAGSYRGRFMCTYKGKEGDLFAPPVDVPVEGDVHIEVVDESSGSEFVAVGTGELEGNANGLYDFRTTVMGMLDCSKGTFSGAVTGGMVSFFGIPIGDFGGPLNASYDGVAAKFTDGQWALTFGPTGGVCAGPWEASLDTDASVSDAGVADASVSAGG